MPTFEGNFWKKDSLVEGDEQLDRPNIRACIELCQTSAAYFFQLVVQTTAYHLCRYSLHLLLRKTSGDYLLFLHHHHHHHHPSALLESEFSILKTCLNSLERYANFWAAAEAAQKTNQILTKIYFLFFSGKNPTHDDDVISHLKKC